MALRVMNKVLEESFAIPLTHLYNASMLSGIFPSDWKHSHITPAHKGGPIEDPMVPVLE